jgi:tetratricopeptide (TPR) repeat protein
MTVLMVSMAIYGAYWYLSQPIQMEGDFNIAVAQFGEVTENGVEKTAVATQLSDRLFGFLESELATWDLGIEIETTHKNISLITEVSEAEEIAKKTNANLVIYGEVLSSGDSAEFFPEFYVADHSDTTELAGQSRLGLPISFATSELSHEDDVNEILRRRATMLLYFVEGLTYLSHGDYDAAVSSLSSAVTRAEELQPFEGKEILYLMKGLALQKEINLEEAEQSYEEALKINPEYARAHIGLGNVHYLRYQESGFTDGAQLARALFEYQQALEATDRSRGAHIEEKVNVALGNIYLIRAQQQQDPALFQQAVDRYDRVIAHYKEDPEDVKLIDLAAIAYFGLGAAHERQLDYVQAKEFYQQCLDIVSDKGLKQQVEERLQYVEEQLM